LLSEVQIQQTFAGKNILFGVLNWGLGHATRMVPLINQAIKSGNSVVICSNGIALSWLKHYYPHLVFIDLNTAEIRYGTNKLQTFFKLFSLYFGYSKLVNSERKYVCEFIKKYNIDLIISDNRPGVYSAEVYSIYITHQLYVKAPFGLSNLASKIHASFYKPFNTIWVPDFESNIKSLAGELSRNYFNDNRVMYIGPLSRFSKFTLSDSSTKSYDLAILSGPEPQRSILEANITKDYSCNNKNLKLVRGVLSAENVKSKSSNIELLNSVTDSQLLNLISRANKIICRSGYSTIMDLYVLNKIKSAEFFPTPGQTEQEYLAKYMAKRI
jgi:uncharacterized protein (TIGR00661 family)